MKNLKTEKEIKNIESWSEKIQELQEHTDLEKATQDFLNKRKGNFVIYAVDTDIVRCYTKPWEIGNKDTSKSTGKNKPIYGEIFPPDMKDTDSATGLIFSLAHHIFLEHDERWPVFQLPAHSQETTDIFSVVADKAGLNRNNLKDDLYLLENWISDVESKISTSISNKVSESDSLNNKEKEKDEDKDLSIILEEIEKFLISRKESPIAEMNRYLSLLNKGALISLDDASNISTNQPAEVIKVLEAISKKGTVQEWIDEITYRDQWMDALSKAQGKARSDRHRINQRTDAEALARLEMVNKRLEKFNGRLIFITGAPAIFKAAKIYEDHHSGFANKYIRHLHSFLPYLIAKFDTKKIDRVWDFMGFRAILGLEKGQEKSVYDKSEKCNQFKKIEDEWKEVRKNIISIFVTQDKDTSCFLDEIAKIREYIETDKQELKQSLKDFSIKLRENLLKEIIELAVDFAETGVKFILARKASKDRNPPYIYFDSYKNTTELFKELITCEDLSSIGPNLSEKLNKIRGETSGEQPGVNDLGYLYLLVFSGFFANEGRWNIAAELAGYAVQIAEILAESASNEKEDNLISGREAYHLQACTLRLSVRSFPEHKKVRNLLQKAEEALKKDKKRNSNLKIDQYRFDVEKIAVTVSELHFMSMPDFANAENDQRNDILKKSEEGLKEAFVVLEQVRDSEESKLSLLYLHVNILQFISISLKNEIRQENFLKNVQDSLGFIEDFFDDNSSIRIRKTNLIKAYVLFAKCYLKSVGIPQPGLKKNKLESFFASAIESAEKSTVKYDSNRYKNLKTQCCSIYSIEPIT